MFDSPRWSDSRAALCRAATRVFVAAGVLWIAELMHRAPGGGLRDALDPLALAVALVSVVALAELVVRALWAVCRRLSPRHPELWLSVTSLALLPAVWRHDPWAPTGGAAQLVGVAVVLLLSARVATELASRVDSARVRRRARRWASLALATALLASLASATEWWPRLAAFWFAGLALFAAILLGRLVVSPAARVPRGVGLAQAALVLICVAATARHWGSPRALRLTGGEGGVLPGARAVAHGGTEPWRARAHEGGVDSDAGWTGLRDAADSARRWQVVSGVGRVAPQLGTSPLGGSGAQALTFVTPEARFVQELALEPDLAELRAGLWVRRRGGASSAPLRVSLQGAGAPVSRVVRPTEAWTEVVLDARTDLLPADTPAVHALDNAAISPDTGAAWWTALPDAFAPFAADVDRDPRDAQLLLFEDGVPLGPARSLHDAIREHGGGAYSHWQSGLYFSTSDGSDPRRNGRAYRVELHRRESREAPRARLQLSLVDGDTPAEFWVWGPGLDARRDASSAAPESSPRLVPTPGPRADAVRAATRHVLLVVLGEAPAADARRGALGHLGDEGLRLSQAYAASDRPAASLAALATGLAPPVVLAAHELGAPIPTWIERLQAVGFHGFVQGVDGFGEPLDTMWSRVTERGEGDPRAPGLEDELLRVLRAHAEERVAALVHWEAARGGRASLEQRLAELRAGLHSAGLDARTLVAVVAARGAEPGSTLEGARVLGRGEQVLRVPCVLRLPGLDLPRELNAPLGAGAVAATILDVAAPTSAALLSHGSLLAELSPRERAASLPEPVMAWTDGARVLRLGDAKYVADERLGTHLLYDLASDPGERRPVYDAGRAALLAQRVEREEARLELLTRQLVSRHESELRQDLLAGLLVRELDAQALEPLLAEFWSLNAATRGFLMETIYGRRVAGLADSLDALARRRFDRDDQVLLVLRAWAGSERAAQELPRRLPELAETARRWLLEILPDLPRPLVRELATPLTAALRVTWLSHPDPDADAGRLLAVGAANLARAQGRRVASEVKRWLVALHGQWASEHVGPVATLRDGAFGADTLFDALTVSLAPGDEPLLDELRPSVSAARGVPALVQALGTRAAQERLLALIDRWGAADADGTRLVDHMLPGLRALDDVEFGRRALARVEHWRRGRR